MNIYGHKKKIKELKEKMKIGKRELGIITFNKLNRMKEMHQNIIKIIKSKKPKNSKRRFRTKRQ